MNRHGLTLLEVMVALVILGLVATAILETVGNSVRATVSSREWTTAMAYAEEAMESTKLVDPELAATGLTTVADGYRREVEVDQWTPGIRQIVVTVRTPSGRTLAITRLARAE